MRESWATSRLCVPVTPESSLKICGQSLQPRWTMEEWCLLILWESKCNTLPASSHHFVFPDFFFILAGSCVTYYATLLTGLYQLYYHHCAIISGKRAVFLHLLIRSNTHTRWWQWATVQGGVCLWCGWMSFYIEITIWSLLVHHTM